MSDYNGECGCDECAEMKEKDDRLKRATALLREWRDKFGGRDVHVFGGGVTASPGDLVRDTTRFLEGR